MVLLMTLLSGRWKITEVSFVKIVLRMYQASQMLPSKEPHLRVFMQKSGIPSN